MNLVAEQKESRVGTVSVPVKRMIRWTHGGWYAPSIYFNHDNSQCVMIYQYIADYNAVSSHAQMCAKENNLAEAERFDERPRNAEKYSFII